MFVTEKIPITKSQLAPDKEARPNTFANLSDKRHICIELAKSANVH